MRADWADLPERKKRIFGKKHYPAASKSSLTFTGMPQLSNGWFIYDTRSFDRGALRPSGAARVAHLVGHFTLCVSPRTQRHRI